MIKIAKIKFAPWDKSYDFLVGELELKKNDYVIVNTVLGTELGKIEEIVETEKPQAVIGEDGVPAEIKEVVRKADLKDLERFESYQKQRGHAIEKCKEFIKKLNLPMKLVDVHFSYDGGRVTFAFVSDGRVDFRVLVKDLTHYFQKTIRLHQIGIRDEAKLNADIGACGIPVCCRRHLKVLGNVNADMAEVQQVSHRGAERLSGICGRLKCCLTYEHELYESLAKNMPAMGTQLKTAKGKGEIIGWHVLKQTVDVRLDDDTIVEMPIK